MAISSPFNHYSSYHRKWSFGTLTATEADLRCRQVSEKAL
jgi:hypothetical protein